MEAGQAVVTVLGWALIIGMSTLAFGVIGIIILDCVYTGRPLWRVYYPPEEFDKYPPFHGGYSRRMNYKQACDYASIFNGSVIKHNAMKEELKYDNARRKET